MVPSFEQMRIDHERKITDWLGRFFMCGSRSCLVRTDVSGTVVIARLVNDDGEYIGHGKNNADALSQALCAWTLGVGSERDGP